MNNCKMGACDRGLISPSETAPVKRQCNGFAPVGVRWCRRQDGWAANSIVYTDCAFYWTPFLNFKDPDYEGSGWVAFDTGGMMRRVLDGYDFESYNCNKLDYKINDCITDCGKWRVAIKEPVTVSPAVSDTLPESSRQWSAPMVMCELIAYVAKLSVETTIDTFGHVVDNGDGTFTFINADGSEGPTWIGTDTIASIPTPTVTLRPNANFKWVPTLDANNRAILEEPVTDLSVFDPHDGMTTDGNGGIIIPQDGAYIVSLGGGTIWMEPNPRTSAEGATNGDLAGFALDLDGVGIGGTGTQEWTYAREGSKVHQGIQVGFTATAGQVLTLRTLMGAGIAGKVFIGGLKGFVAWQSDA